MSTQKCILAFIGILVFVLGSYRLAQGEPKAAAKADAKAAPATPAPKEARIDLLWCERAKKCFQSIEGKKLVCPCDDLSGGRCAEHPRLGSYYFTLVSAAPGDWKPGEVRAFTAHVDVEYFDQTATDLAHATGNWSRKPLKKGKLEASLERAVSQRTCAAGHPPVENGDACPVCGKPVKKHTTWQPLDVAIAAHAAKPAGDFTFDVPAPAAGKVDIRLTASGPIEAVLDPDLRVEAQRLDTQAVADFSWKVKE